MWPLLCGVYIIQKRVRMVLGLYVYPIHINLYLYIDIVFSCKTLYYHPPPA